MTKRTRSQEQQEHESKTVEVQYAHGIHAAIATQLMQSPAKYVPSSLVRSASRMGARPERCLSVGDMCTGGGGTRSAEEDDMFESSGTNAGHSSAVK